MALLFDGTNDYIADLGNNHQFFTQPSFSIEFWLKYGYATSSVSEKGFATNGGNPTTDSPTHLFQRNGETHRLYGGGYITSGNKTLTQNEWYHIYFGHDADTDKTYFGVNGTVEEVADAGNYNVGGQANLFIGSGYSGYMSGIYDEFRVSTICRYTGNYTPPVTRFVTDASTRALYHMDEGSGLLVADSSANGFDMAIAEDTTAPSWVEGYPFVTTDISKVAGLDYTTVAKVATVDKANIAKIIGVA